MIISFPYLNPKFLAGPEYRSGADRVLFELGKGLMSLGHTVYFIGPHTHSPLSTGNLIRKIISSIEGLEYIPKSDAIVSGYWRTIIPVLFEAKILRKGCPFFFIQDFWSPLVMRPFIKGFIFKKIMCPLLKYFDEDNLLANSQMTSDLIYKETGKKPRIINLGIDHDTFYPRRRKENTNVKTIAYIARTPHWKGLKTFLEVMPNVYKNYPNINVVILYREPALRNLSFPFPYELRENVNDDELASVYSSCDVFVSTSWYDTFSLPPLEAMACGAPVVAVDSGGIREYAINEINCLLTPPKDSRALASAISRVLKNENLSQNLSKRGIETAKRFTWSKFIEIFENLLKRSL